MANNDYGMMNQAGGFQSDSDLGMSGVQKNLMPLFLIVDTSGSMHNEKIEQVKTAVEEIKSQLNALNLKNDDAEIKISVLCFDDQPRWEATMEDPAAVNPSFRLGVMTNMGLAFEELETMLSRSKLIKKGSCAGYKRAVMILLTDGIPCDNVDAGIEKLKKNNWFVKGTRIGFAIGEDADTTCLEKFTGNLETVLRVNKISLLSTILSNVAVVASTTNTHTAGVGSEDATTQAQREAEFKSSAEESVSTIQGVIDEQVATGEIDEDDAISIFSKWAE